MADKLSLPPIFFAVYNKILLFILSLVLCYVANSGRLEAADKRYYFDFNEKCKAAYNAMFSLKIQYANELLQQEIEEHPENLIPVFLKNYDDCLTLLFNGDPKEYSKRKVNYAARLELLKQGDTKSPWYNYTIGTVYFQWAAVRIRFNEYFNAATDFRKSYNILKENKKSFPEFKYTQMLLGLEEAFVGTIPDNYKWASNMLGLKGNVKLGTAQIAEFLTTKDVALMRNEASFYYCYLKYSLLADKPGVWDYLDNDDWDFKGNHVFAFMKANFALNDNKANLAEQILRNRTQNASYLNAPIFNYQLGIALLQKLDDDCIVYFDKFLKNNKGNLFVKDAYQKMSFYYLSMNDLPKAILYKNKILKAGTTQIDADKQAQRYAENIQLPNPFLLKARLLCDGGYYAKALDQLKGSKVSDFPNVADQLEFNYRYARIFTLNNQVSKAIPYYEATIKMGRSRQEHFAARSALELGQIYEQQGHKALAIAQYRNCLSMKNHDFKSSLDQKAKAGLDRLGAAK